MLLHHRIFAALALLFFMTVWGDNCLGQGQDDELLNSLKSSYESEGVETVMNRLSKLISEVPTDTTVNAALFVNIAAHVFQGGDRQQAIKILEDADKTFSDNVLLHSVLGQLYWYTDERNGCLRSFKKVLSLDSTHSMARRYLDLLLFVPDDFVPPESMITAHLKVRPLSSADVELDYKAVMGSREHIRGVFGPDDDWPPDDLTLDDDLRALENHEVEHRRRVAFTYTVMSRDESECHGCVYIVPVHLEQYDAQVYMWVTKDAHERGWDSELYSAVKNWIKQKWPFERVAYPGRDIDWDTWNGYEMY